MYSQVKIFLNGEVSSHISTTVHSHMTVQELISDCQEKFSINKHIKCKIFDSTGGELSDDDMVNMVNWFAEGAITTVSNAIYELIEEKDCDRMERGLTTGCRCGSCYSWQFLDENNKA